jgi:hypothetical protein
MKYTSSIFILGVLATACVSKQKIMDAPMVSMTHTELRDGQRLQAMGSVTGQFCQDSMHDKNSIGLFDEAIKSAQEESHADFISNASFFKEGSCITLEGIGEKIVADSTASPMAPRTHK